MTGLSGHRLKRIIWILQIVVITALMINRVAYTHIHFLPDGSVVAHAHPYSKSAEGNPDSSHRHSKTELFLFDQLNILMFFFTAAIVLKQYVAFTGFSEPTTDCLLTAFIPHSLGRAPPTCM
jgi:hypothetical protein